MACELGGMIIMSAANTDIDVSRHWPKQKAATIYRRTGNGTTRASWP